MTSLPQTQFIYDRQGNVVNVLPTGSSTDVVAGGHLTETRFAESPLKASAPVTSTSTSTQDVNFPIYGSDAVFGYENPSTPDLDTYKITTALPLVTFNRQPKALDSKPPITGSALPPPPSTEHVFTM